MNQWTGFAHALVGALFLALISTFGDWVWAKFIPKHQVIYGLIHGAVMCACIGAVLGWAARSLTKGILGTLVIGTLISGAFYPLYYLIGLASMFVCWMGLWIAFALWDRKLRREQTPPKSAVLRGALAAILSGAGFTPIYLLWTNPPAEGNNYLIFFAAWLIAFFPGFLPLMLRRKG